MCREHASLFWRDAVAFAAATARLYQADAEMIPSALYTQKPKPIEYEQPEPPDVKTVECRKCGSPFYCRLQVKRTVCDDCISSNNSKAGMESNQRRLERLGR